MMIEITRSIYKKRSDDYKSTTSGIFSSCSKISKIAAETHPGNQLMPKFQLKYPMLEKTSLLGHNWYPIGVSSLIIRAQERLFSCGTFKYIELEVLF